MPKSFDVVLKALVESGPEGWPAALELAEGPLSVIDADVSAVGGGADKVLRVEAEEPYLLHLDFFTGHDTARAATKLRWYNAVLDHRHDLPVRSAAVLLRPEADSPRLTGRLIRRVPRKRPHVLFEYDVFRVWRKSPDLFLRGSLGLVPLAPVASATRRELPGVIEQMKSRLGERRARSIAGELWTATYVLLGLRYSDELAQQLLRGITAMEESVTYQAIVRIGETKGLARGRVEGLREGLLRVGRKLLGEPDQQVIDALNTVDDPARLDELFDRAPEAETWQELLNLPARPTRRGRRSSS